MAGEEATGGGSGGRSGVGTSLWAVSWVGVTDAQLERLERFASPQRRAAAARFLRREDRCRALAGEALARSAIGSSCAVAPREVGFEKGPFGKPRVVGPVEVEFNLSHSGGWVVCALDDQAVGVDVESIAPGVDLGIAERFFGPSEQKWICDAGPDDRTGRFFRLWTLKESYLKAVGLGLRCPLDAFEVEPSPDSLQASLRLGVSSPVLDLPPMHLRSYALDPGHWLALCLSHPRFPARIRALTAAELLDAIGR